MSLNSLQNAIDSKREKIQQLRAEYERIDRSYGDSPTLETSKRRALLPLQNQITQLEVDVRQIETSHEYSEELTHAALFNQAREQRALEQRRQARVQQQQAEYEQYDDEIAALNWSQSGLTDLPRHALGKWWISDIHRRIAREVISERARRLSEWVLLSNERARESIREAAAESGLSYENLYAHMTSNLPPLDHETTVWVDGLAWKIWFDDQGGVVERDYLAGVEASEGSGNSGE